MFFFTPSGEMETHDLNTSKNFHAIQYFRYRYVEILWDFVIVLHIYYINVTNNRMEL